MNLFTFFCCVIVLAITCSSGCTGPVSAPSTEQTTQAATTSPAVTAPLPGITPSFTTAAPQETITTAGPKKTLKDSELWFTIQVPESWEVITERIPNPEGYSGIVYVTSLYNNRGFVNTHEFYIITYAISRDYDQTMRTYLRDTWTPSPTETTVTINGITFDRFESKTSDTVNVAYVVRKGSANERGFASVIEYFVNSSSQYKQQDFESYLSTFRYLAADDISSAAGEEIKR